MRSRSTDATRLRRHAVESDVFVQVIRICRREEVVVVVRKFGRIEGNKVEADRLKVGLLQMILLTLDELCVNEGIGWLLSRISRFQPRPHSYSISFEVEADTLKCRKA